MSGMPRLLFAPLPGEEREMTGGGSGQGCALLPRGTGVPQLAVEGWRVTHESGLGRWVKQEEGGAKFCSESPWGASKGTVA